ncbi:MAG: DMT family transporter [Myxococcales bacterium]|nr:DMT family transporter [Myxococcales bacterium]MCB9523214.1 DMT family transporter [Myxococcales bacterium]
MRRGPLYMVIASLGFVAMVAFVKQARGQLSTFEVMLWRGLLAAPLVYLIARGQGGLRIHRRGLFLGRMVLGTAAMFGAYFGAAALPVADHALIWRSQPLFVAALAPLFLGHGERPGGRVWGLLLVGLVGCGVLLGPKVQLGAQALVPGMVVLAGAGFAGAAHVAVRALNRSETPAALVFWFQIAIITAAGLGAVSTTGLHWPPADAWPWLAGASLASVVGQLFMTHAYRHDRAAVVSAAGYMAPVWAVLVDLIFFGQAPGGWALLGGGLIVASSALLLVGGPRATPATP